MNVGSNAILLTNQDNFSGTTAANRFDFGRDVVLFPGKSLDILYNTTAARWKLVSNGLYDDVEQVYFNERFNAPVSGSSGDYSFWDFVSENGIGGIAPVAGRFAEFLSTLAAILLGWDTSQRRMFFSRTQTQQVQPIGLIARRS
jgi:hypothetical protein